MRRSGRVQTQQGRTGGDRRVPFRPLANAAALVGRVNAYLVWGVDDKTHKIVGTTFKPAAAGVSNEELENWVVMIFEVIG